MTPKHFYEKTARMQLIVQPPTHPRRTHSSRLFATYEISQTDSTHPLAARGNNLTPGIHAERAFCASLSLPSNPACASSESGKTERLIVFPLLMAFIRPRPGASLPSPRDDEISPPSTGSTFFARVCQSSSSSGGGGSFIPFFPSVGSLARALSLSFYSRGKLLSVFPSHLPVTTRPRRMPLCSTARARSFPCFSSS